MSPSLAASGRHSAWAPRALVMATRVCWMTPSGMMPSSSPFSRLYNWTSPRNSPRPASGSFSSRIEPL